ncbi:type Z 30S ribosomal protein S14 [Candidatus Peregrinibacteria bacterium]|nr:type Z 30S ribosomal protein S14 [Candidatus Peregrinibacteria bacterium]
MARKSLRISTTRKQQNYLKSLEAGKKPKFPTRVYNRCPLCGRNHGYLRKFDMCRICLRELAQQGKISGMTKSSW